jgi:hypothetical protein
MPHIDILLERLKAYDEEQICDLLDITTEDLLAKFRSRVLSKKQYLESEMEILSGTDMELDTTGHDEFDDGFEIEEY